MGWLFSKTHAAVSMGRQPYRWRRMAGNRFAWNKMLQYVPLHTMAETRTHLPAAAAELHELIVDSIHEGVFTVDHDFRITSFNREAERITGVLRLQAVGKKCYEVFRASICQNGCALKETLSTGRPLRDVRIDVLNASMVPVPLMVSTAVLRRGDRLEGGFFHGEESAHHGPAQGDFAAAR